MASTIQVIKRDTIPPVRPRTPSPGERISGELRDFRWHDLLRDFMPSPSQVSVSWVTLNPGEILHVLVHPAHSLVVFYAGSGELTGEMQRAVSRDQIVVVPAGCRYGLTAGPQGLSAVSVALGERLHPSQSPRESTATSSVDEVVAYSARRCAAFEGSPMIRMVQDGTLVQNGRRERYLEQLEVWTRALGRVLVARQASSEGLSVDAPLLEQLVKLSGARPRVAGAPEGRHLGTGGGDDPILVAIGDWFVHQMFVLDKAEKATIVDLVLRHAGEAYARWAGRSPHRSVRDRSGWPGAPGLPESEFHDAFSSISLRESLRMQGIAREAWDMLDALSSRMEELACHP